MKKNIFKIANIFTQILAITITLLFHINTANAAKNLYVVDVYGTKKITSDQIEKRFNKELTLLATLLKANTLPLPKSKGALVDKAFLKMRKSIMASGHFAYLKISPVIYANTSILYITFDIVDKKDKHRLSYFLPKPDKNIAAPDYLFSSWTAYETLGRDLAFNKKETVEFKNCPAHHCIFGFEHPQLKKYESIFSDAEKYKTTLLDIVRNDKDEHKRTIAIYLLAHIKNGQELVNLLVPFIYDSSPGVRNSTMRVLGKALEKNNKLQIPLNKIVTALDFPDSTDRNKAAYALIPLANNSNNAAYIKKHAGQILIAMLKLQQPISHNPAYLVLTEMSGKKYGERDYKAWEQWLRQK